MLRLTEIKLPLEHPAADLQAAILKRLGIAEADLLSVSIYKRSDARGKDAILFIYSVDVAVKDEAAMLKRLKGDKHIVPTPDMEYRFVAQAPADLTERPIVIGTGPCGLFAGLILAQMGFRPIILERGKAVRERTKDTWGLWRNGKLNPESNVQFGEGGAGTFSDGKLYSQIKDPRHLRPQGADRIRQGRRAGGNPVCRASRISAPSGWWRWSRTCAPPSKRWAAKSASRAGSTMSTSTNGAGARRDARRRRSSSPADHVVLAVGHSARDTFQMLHDRGVYIEAKPFSIGFRIEHPQALIDRAASAQCRQPAAGRGRLQAGASLPATAARSTASACARAARWWPPPPSRGAW